MKENNEITLTSGYFLLNDGSEVNPSSINNRNKGKVIGYILDNSGAYSGRNIVIAINSGPYPMHWGNSNYLYGTDVPGLTNYEYSYGSTEPYRDKNGKNNTQIVVDYCNSKGWSLSNAGESFSYCVTYSPGYKDGEWYLPSAGELKLFCDSREKFRSDCNTAGISTNMNSDNSEASYFWTSTEYSDNDSWCLDFIQPELSFCIVKNGDYYAVPFLAID